MRTIWNFIRVATVVVCALPGIVWTIVMLITLASRHPFDTDPGTRQSWDTLMTAESFTMVASPALVLMMWLARWRPSTLSASGANLTTILCLWSTLGAILFWVKFGG